MFKAMRQIKEQGGALAFLYSHIGMIFSKLDAINKRVLLVKGDFYMEEVALGMKHLSQYFAQMSESYHQHLYKDLTYTATFADQSFSELWDFREIFKNKFLKLSEQHDDNKRTLFLRGDVESYKIKDTVWVAHHREILETDF